MAAEYLKYDDLQQELDDAKNTLVTLNDNIRRIIGRNPKDLRNDKYKAQSDLKRNDGDRQGGMLGDLPKNKRRSYDAKSVFNRLSAPAPRPGDDEIRPRLNSRVIREMPSRQEIVAAQGGDSESRARNRRMFGSLMGTLHKFCQEEKKQKQKEEKKAQIEKKLEEQQQQERITLRKEREALFLDRKRKQLEIRRLELKMNRLKDFQVWESSITNLKHHIRTKAKPHIYFNPRIMDKKTEKLLAESQAAVENIKAVRRDALGKELTELENSLKMNEFENDDHFERVGHNNDCTIAKQTVETVEVEIKTEPNHSVVSEITIKKGDLDSKENKSRNLNEPSLISSIVVVKNQQTGIEKVQ